MKLRFLLAASLATGILAANADTRTNGGTAYLLSQSVDVSRDFADFTNTYFFADSLAGFDTQETSAADASPGLQCQHLSPSATEKP